MDSEESRELSREVRSLSLKVERLLEKMESRDRVVGDLSKCVFGNGRPGLRIEVDRATQLLRYGVWGLSTVAVVVISLTLKALIEYL